MLYRLSYSRNLWAKMDSNHRSRKTADLQSAPFGHSGIRPRTCDPEILPPSCRHSVRIISQHPLLLIPAPRYRQHYFPPRNGCKFRYKIRTEKIFWCFFYLPLVFSLFFCNCLTSASIALSIASSNVSAIFCE